MTDSATTRMVKRYKAARRRHGNCCICTFREVVNGAPVCRGFAARGQGMCAEDGQLPMFRLDETALEGFRDDAR